MKFIVTLSFIALSLSSFSQNSISRIIEKVKPIKSPLSQEANRQLFYSDKLDTLSAVDRAYVTNELKKASQVIVNPKGGNSFADLDYRDPWGFWDYVTSMSVIGVIKQSDSAEFLLYLVTKESESRQAILAACDAKGRIVSWIFANGDFPGNRHGNLSRDMAILPSGIIKIEEASWGDNTNAYGFTGSFKVISNRFVKLKSKFTGESID